MTVLKHAKPRNKLLEREVEKYGERDALLGAAVVFARDKLDLFRSSGGCDSGKAPAVGRVEMLKSELGSSRSSTLHHPKTHLQN